MVAAIKTVSASGRCNILKSAPIKFKQYPKIISVIACFAFIFWFCKLKLKKADYTACLFYKKLFSLVHNFALA